MHLDEAPELARGELIARAQAVAEGQVEEVGGGDANAAFAGEELGVDVWWGGRRRRRGEADLAEGAVAGEARVVAVVAQVVKGFVGVLDRDFAHGGRGEEGAGEGVVEVRAVRVGLVRGEDEELGDARAGGEGGGGGEGRGGGEGEG